MKAVRNQPDGSQRVATNGYFYTKVDGKWILTHHVIARLVAGRPIDTETERVIFIDGDRSNLTPENISIVPKKLPSSKAAKAARLRARIADLQAELEQLET